MSTVFEYKEDDEAGVEEMEEVKEGEEEGEEIVEARRYVFMSE